MDGGPPGNPACCKHSFFQTMVDVSIAFDLIDRLHPFAFYRKLGHRNFRPSSAEIPTASPRSHANRSIQLPWTRKLGHRNFRPSSAEIPTASSRWLANRSISSLRLEIFGIEIFGQAQRKALRLLLDGLPLDALESCPAAVMLLSRTVGR